MNKKMNLNWSVDEITGNMPDISFMRSKEFQVKETSNTELLKDYLKRLGNGEDLESVKKDFVQNFSDVEKREHLLQRCRNCVMCIVHCFMA